jgi:hypothetical protein
VERGLGAREQRDGGGAGFGVREGNCAADAFGCAGDEDVLACEVGFGGGDGGIGVRVDGWGEVEACYVGTLNSQDMEK